MKPVFTNTECQIDGDRVTIDTHILATTYEERERLRKPWWVVVCGAFIFPSEEGHCIALVKRTPRAVVQQNKWTIVVAGAVTGKHELRDPSIGLEREIYEELVMHRDGERLHPLFEAHNIIGDKITITDTSIDETHILRGRLYVTDSQVFFMRVYQCEIPIEKLVLADGEYDEINHRCFDREIAVVPLDELNGIVTPVKVFKDGKEVSTRKIDLSPEPTPTMAWFKQYIKTG